MMLNKFAAPVQRSNLRFVSCSFCLVAFAALHVGSLLATDVPAPVSDLVESTCLDCHDSSSSEGGLDLESLGFDLSDQQTSATWIKIHDRVQSGEMPPADYGELDKDAWNTFLAALAAPLREANRVRQQDRGRVILRRLNRNEYEYTLRDLLHLPDLQVADILPSDASSHGFDNVSDALTVSSVQIGRYLQAAEHAIDAAMHVRPKPKLQTWDIQAKDDKGVARAVSGDRRQGVPIGDAIGLLRQGPVA